MFGDLLDSALQQLKYPNSQFGVLAKDPNEARRVFSYFARFDKVPMPERFPELVDKADAEMLIRYLAKDGKPFIEREEYPEAALRAFKSREQYPRAYPLTVPNVVLYMLRAKAWIPCEDGRKHRPDEVILSSKIPAGFAGVFVRHTLFHNTQTHSKQDVREMNGVLALLGALQSLQDLTSDKIYALLTEQPLRDPFGQSALAMYKQLLENVEIDLTDRDRAEFIQNGKLFGRQDGNQQYFPVRELRYSSSPSLPRVVSEKIKRFVVEQGDGERIHRVFGVAPLGRKEFEVALDTDAISANPVSVEVQERWRLALPYICAWRLSTASAKTLRRLKDVQLHVCSRAKARIKIQDFDEEQVLLEVEGEGLVTKDAHIAIVWSALDAASDPVFWRVVGDLCAEILEAQVAADVSAFLACDAASHMQRLLARLTGQDAQSALERAYEFLGSEPEQEGGSDAEDYTDFIPPKPASTATEQQHQPEESTTTSPPPPQTYSITNFRAPEHKPSRPRALVVTRAFTSVPSSLRGRHLVSEEDAWRVVEAFERKEGRFPLPVAHLRGSQGFGCDVISFASEKARAEAKETGKVNPRNVKRYIEMKCRTNRTGTIQLSDNELRAANKRTGRYYIYRIYRDTHDYRRLELAILRDPVNSRGRRRKELIEFDLCRGSGAEWFELTSENPSNSGESQNEDTS